jgi:hypothetical protein
MPSGRVRSILQTLTDYRAEFIVVGGVAAVLRGVGINTFDLDVVHSTSPENIARLMSALEELDACYRLQPELRLRPGISHLASPGHQLLMTRFGPLDLPGAIGKGRAYSDLLPHTVEMEVGETLRFLVLDLETQIAVKEELGGAKDLLALPLLRQALAESRRTK